MDKKLLLTSMFGFGEDMQLVFRNRSDDIVEMFYPDSIRDSTSFTGWFLTGTSWC
jgi:hypothetical protein